MGKKGDKKKNKTKKIIVLKSREDRVKEIVEVFKKLRNLGIDNKFDGISEFNAICKEYIKGGESKQGKIKILGTKRILEYILPRRKNTEITVNLKFDNAV